jgi:hypothetical protein
MMHNGELFYNELGWGQVALGRLREPGIGGISKRNPWI